MKEESKDNICFECGAEAENGHICKACLEKPSDNTETEHREEDNTVEECRLSQFINMMMFAIGIIGM